MPWIHITDEDLDTSKMAPLVSALRSVATAPGQEDPMIEFRKQAIKTVRRKVAACQTNRVDSNPDKVPDSLKDITINIIMRAAKNRLEIPLTEDERTQWNKDDRELDKVATCDMPVDEPEQATAPPVQSMQPGPKISGRKRRFGRDQQSGV